jgi:hypothetical protein
MFDEKTAVFFYLEDISLLLCKKHIVFLKKENYLVFILFRLTFFFGHIIFFHNREYKRQRHI